MFKKAKRKALTLALVGAILAGGISAAAPASANQRVWHGTTARHCEFRLRTIANNTQAVVDDMTCVGGMQIQATITFRPDGGSVGMTLTHRGNWAGNGGVSVANRTVANHHWVSSWFGAR